MSVSAFDYEDLQFGGFDKLMPFRVREILLVASPYDAFIIAEDDRLTELIFSEYLDLNLRYAPRVTRASTAEEALQRLEKETFDLIITMRPSGNMDMGAFTKAVAKASPGVPVILLVYNLLDAQRLTPEERSQIARIFLWSGDVRILMAIIKQVEDRRNLDHDMKVGGVQTIILVEDSVRFYSYYLPMIYTEVMKQTQRLIAEGVNLSHKLLRMRARPKILLATTFEEAVELYGCYRSHLLALITDQGLPRGGEMDPDAGLELITRVKEDRPDAPVLLQSSDAGCMEAARRHGAAFLKKGSQFVARDIHRFLMEHCGFGDFVFCRPDGTILRRVADLHSMLEALPGVPDESLAYHVIHNHFSTWLLARTEFELASKIRPRRMSEFRDVGELRRYLIDTLAGSRHKKEFGAVSEFSKRYFTKETPFVRIGGGSLGGKGRGLAFLNSFLSRRDPSGMWEGVRIRVPNAAVLATDVFDSFMEQNDLYQRVQALSSDAVVRKAFLRAKLPSGALRSLADFVRKVRLPLAVRSSSLMEDSAVRPFAGIYETYMLPNNHPDEGMRFNQLRRAVKLVYASMFTQEARTYLGSTAHPQYQEKMAVIIQRLVGRTHGRRLYPSFSGVAQSYNYYPVGKQAPEDGIAHVALGLGETIVKGRLCLSFSPAHPQSLFQFASTRDFIANSQREFVALDIGRSDFLPEGDPSANLTTLGLEEAEADGVLAHLGSTYSAENDRVYDGVFRKGPRLITFANILKHDAFPLAGVLKSLFEIGAEATGSPMEMEFAVDLDRREFNILQIRPMLSWIHAKEVKLDQEQRESSICYTPRALGHGRLDNVSDIVFVKPEPFDTAKTKLIAREIGEINARLEAEGRGYMLVGPGRWGSADPSLGIPVGWGDISAARLIVETTLEDFVVEPSYGTHFLHNVIALGIGYFAVRHDTGEGRIDWKWLAGQAPYHESGHLRHLRMQAPLDIRIDGRSGRGAVLKPS